MKLLLDTNVCIDLLRAVDSQVSIQFLAAVRAGHDLMVSTITLFELETGIARRGRIDGEVAGLDELIRGPFQIATFDRHASKAAGDLAAEMLATGRQLAACDALIAGHARALGAQLVTADAKLALALKEVGVVDWRVP
ncbi:MAG: type II toxin-antitoxin system VapC family toxin [Hyphomonadaceae bacterium]|nr:type II toxin-antitoxin system VapC family toxin [Hyphomonadaceae bacterium]